MKIFNTHGYLENIQGGLAQLKMCLAKSTPPILFVHDDDIKVCKKAKQYEYEKLKQLYEILPLNISKPLGYIDEVLFIEYIKPFSKKISTFADLLITMNKENIVFILNQLIDIFIIFKKYKVTHNDMKIDNILITVNLKVVLIDFETVSFNSTPYENLDEKTRDLFGLVGYSEWTDLHLILLEIWTRVKRKKPIWGNDFFTFLLSCMPYELLLLNNEGSKYVTEQNRLSKVGKEFIAKNACSLEELKLKPFLN